MKHIALTTLALAACTATYGQSLVAGWEFDNGLQAFDDVSPSMTYAADKTQVLDYVDAVANTVGSMVVTYDANLFNGDAGTINGSLSSNLNGASTVKAPLDSFDDETNTFVFNSITEFGIDAVELIFSADTSGAEFYNNWNFSLGIGSVFGDNIALSWEYSLDGSAYSAIAGGSSSISATDAQQSFAITNEVSDSMFVKLNLSGLNAGDDYRLAIDNVAIVGTVVPEPSAFAAIAGVFALGFVAIRRRK